jgi:hypothetical protein
MYFCNRGVARFCDFGVESLLKIDFWLKSTFGCTSPILEKIGENGGSLAITRDWNGGIIAGFL